MYVLKMAVLLWKRTSNKSFQKLMIQFFSEFEKEPSSACWSHYGITSSPAMASLLAQTVKNLPAMQEAQVWSLGQEDTLEKGMATHSGVLAWRTPWTEEPGGLLSMGVSKELHRTGKLTLSAMIGLLNLVGRVYSLPGNMRSRDHLQELLP